MTAKTHWKRGLNYEYLGSHDFNQGEQSRDLKIISVGYKLVHNLKGKKENCIVAVLENSKPMIINKVNAKSITKVCKSKYLEDWAGHTITVFVKENEKAFGEIMDVLRVKNIPPIKVVNDQTLMLERDRILTAKNINELTKLYQSSPYKEHPLIIEVTKDLKQKFTNESN